MSSVIRVPSQASTYVSALLFALSQEIGHVGGHAMDRQILEHLSGVTLLGVVEAYENLVKELESKCTVVVPQPCALQLFYNLKFVIGVLTPLKDTEVFTAKGLLIGHKAPLWVNNPSDVLQPFRCGTVSLLRRT